MRSVVIHHVLVLGEGFSALFEVAGKGHGHSTRGSHDFVQTELCVLLQVRSVLNFNSEVLRANKVLS